MLDLFNIPTPQTANYQEFYGGGDANDIRSWSKPRGASMVRILMIGAGGSGGNGSSSAGGGGGGSGAVTSWIGPAMFVPDILFFQIGKGGFTSNGTVTNLYINQSGGTYSSALLQANGGSSGGTSGGGAGGAAFTANQFTACGIFTSIAGQAGTSGSTTGAGSNQPASSATFLSGGAGGAGGSANTGGSVTPNY